MSARLEAALRDETGTGDAATAIPAMSAASSKGSGCTALETGFFRSKAGELTFGESEETGVRPEADFGAGVFTGGIRSANSASSSVLKSGTSGTFLRTLAGDAFGFSSGATFGFSAETDFGISAPNRDGFGFLMERGGSS